MLATVEVATRLELVSVYRARAKLTVGVSSASPIESVPSILTGNIANEAMAAYLSKGYKCTRAVALAATPFAAMASGAVTP